MNFSNKASSHGSNVYGIFLLFIAGMGGLLYGVDVGIISAALLYLSKTIDLNLTQTSAIVAAVLGGGMLSSLVAGFFADWFGRKTMMIVSGFLFVASVLLITLSHGFPLLFAGRLLQGLSGGIIAVVVPLYLAETLSAHHRGRGSAIFQLMLTIGIAMAALIGWFYTRQTETALTSALGNPALIRAAEDHAWRAMFRSVIYSGALFLLGSFFLEETPRWLFKRGRHAEALSALRRSSSEEEALLQLHEMEALSSQGQEAGIASRRTLLQRRYVVPFLLACLVLAFNQMTGINSILSYLVLILKQAGMSARHATQGDFAVKALNCAMTLVAVALVDRKGRNLLLIVGTMGIVVALSGGALLFQHVEAKRVDLRAEIQKEVRENGLTVPLKNLRAADSHNANPMELTVLYKNDGGDRLTSALSTDSDAVLTIRPDPSRPHAPQLVIQHAFYGPIPGERTGWLIAACMALFIASFSVGPGVVVWLALSELMPTRIRSVGMGIALLLNQGVSTSIAAVFLPIVGNRGYAAMFAFWAACSLCTLSSPSSSSRKPKESPSRRSRPTSTDLYRAQRLRKRLLLASRWLLDDYDLRHIDQRSHRRITSHHGLMVAPSCGVSQRPGSTKGTVKSCLRNLAGLR